MATAETPENLPVLYFGHGAPPLADDELWTSQFAAWSAELPRPKAILVISAHWESAPLTIGATTTVPLVYDFWGFPERYYQVTYPAPEHRNAHRYAPCSAAPAPLLPRRPLAASTTAPTCR